MYWSKNDKETLIKQNNKKYSQKKEMSPLPLQDDKI